MGINYKNLDVKTRNCMLEEIELDTKTNSVYFSERLNDIGKSSWIILLKEAFEKHNDDWLASELKSKNLLKTTELSKSSKGNPIIKKVPFTAAETLSEGEFNRYYVRGLCKRAMNEGIKEVVVYRGKEVISPRPESEMMIGKRINAEILLNDLRKSKGVEPALGLPKGPNSGLTICLI